ncbi:unnamed protein product [Laminaria digitata]
MKGFHREDTSSKSNAAPDGTPLRQVIIGHELSLSENVKNTGIAHATTDRVDLLHEHSVCRRNHVLKTLHTEPTCVCLDNEKCMKVHSEPNPGRLWFIHGASLRGGLPPATPAHKEGRTKCERSGQMFIIRCKLTICKCQQLSAPWNQLGRRMHAVYT